MLVMIDIVCRFKFYWFSAPDSQKLEWKISDENVEAISRICRITNDGKLRDQNFKEKIILADEISPDNCRLWDKKNRAFLTATV